VTRLRPEDRFQQDVAFTRDVRRRAVLRALTEATDADDGAELLAVLGLDPREGRPELAHTVEVPIGVVHGPPRFSNSPKRPPGRR
jgi:hypothetical protein